MGNDPFDFNADGDSIGVRLKRIRAVLKISQKGLARQLGLSSSTICEVEGNKFKPSYELYSRLVDKLDVNLYYLLYGIGGMFRPPDGEQTLNLLEFPAVSRSFLHMFKYSEIFQYSILCEYRKLILYNGDTIQFELKENNIPPFEK